MTKYYLYPIPEWQDFGQRFLHIEGNLEGHNLRNEFFEACKDKGAFLKFIERYLKIASGEKPPLILKRGLTEKGFIEPPEETQQDIYKIYKDIPDWYMHNPTFWFSVILEMIKQDIIEPSFLANNNRFNGKQRLDLLTKKPSENNKDLDPAVRQILRRLCNIAPRGKRTLIEPNDCPISGVYWRQALLVSIKEVSQKKLKLKEISNQLNMNLYKEICEGLFSRKSYYGCPEILAGLVIFLKYNQGIKKEKVKSLLKEMGKITAWKAVDLLDIEEICEEFKKLNQVL